ncbi:unnamed protein product [Brugia timori]|uniref:Transmembrane protein n=1 Tax=Brugia timori TaxID=42155 RepID=A0A0R3QTH6_9BILA|nr:unnamed protein product [Brugia timori]
MLISSMHTILRGITKVVESVSKTNKTHKRETLPHNPVRYFREPEDSSISNHSRRMTPIRQGITAAYCGLFYFVVTQVCFSLFCMGITAFPLRCEGFYQFNMKIK